MHDKMVSYALQLRESETNGENCLRKRNVGFIFWSIGFQIKENFQEMKFFYSIDVPYN